MLTSQAQQQEDRTFVDEAVRAGKISAEMSDFWLSSMASDRAGTRNVIHSRPSAASEVAASSIYKNWSF